jgi:moderate conductance mechanosensitive channel
MTLISPTLINSSLLVLIIILTALLINAFLRSLIRVPHQLETRRGKTYLMVVRNTITLVLVIITVQIILMVLGINVVPLLASAGVLGIVIGIGARSLFEDLIAGFFLISHSKVAIGDYIMIGNDLEGTVAEMGFKNLTLIGPGGALIIVPNGQVKQIVNNSYGIANNIIEIPVKPNQDIDKVLKCAEKVLKSFKDDPHFVVNETSKIIGITKIDVQSALILTVVLVTDSGLRGLVDNEYRYRLIKSFRENNLKFA